MRDINQYLARPSYLHEPNKEFGENEESINTIHLDDELVTSGDEPVDDSGESDDEDNSSYV